MFEGSQGYIRLYFLKKKKYKSGGEGREGRRAGMKEGKERKEGCKEGICQKCRKKGKGEASPDMVLERNEVTLAL